MLREGNSYVQLTMGSPMAVDGLLGQAWQEAHKLDFTGPYLPHHRPLAHEAGKREARRLAAALHRADKHYLMDDFIRMAQVLSISPPAELLQMATLARPRFDTMWIEWNNVARLAATMHEREVDATHMTTRMGMLIENTGDHWRATVFNRTPAAESYGKTTHVMIWPIGIDFDFTGSRPMAIPNEATRAALGNDYVKLCLRLDPSGSVEPLERVQSLLAQTPAGPMGAAWGQRIESVDSENILRRESEGDGRILLAVLALLACNPATITEPVPKGGVGPVRDMPIGRYLPKWERKVVKLARSDLSLPEVKRLISESVRGASGDRRLHKVTGAWHQSRKKGSADCNHHWEPRLNDLGQRVGSDQYACTHCQRLRWWHPPHYRGTAFEGTVEKEFEITAKGR
jgi:hypothetical protein